MEGIYFPIEIWCNILEYCDLRSSIQYVANLISCASSITLPFDVSLTFGLRYFLPLESHVRIASTEAWSGIGRLPSVFPA
jgi:hypothetical protein